MWDARRELNFSHVDLASMKVESILPIVEAADAGHDVDLPLRLLAVIECWNVGR